MQAIVAVSRNWGIGKEGELLFSIPADMRFFRSMTSGKTVVMGRKTLESLPNGMPLKNRRNIVISSRFDYQVEGAEVVHSPAEAVHLLGDETGEQVFVIGGGEVYRAMLPFCETIYVTKVDAQPQADRCFPDLDSMDDWRLAEQGEEQSDGGYNFRFCVYKRK